MRPTEAQIHQAFVEYVERKYPMLSPYLIHIPNEGKRSPSEGAKQKRLGLRKGVPDLFFAKPCNHFTPGYIGMWLEIKAPGKKPTKSQLEYLALLRSVGYYAIWCDRLDWIINYFERYALGMEHEQGRDRACAKGALSKDRAGIQENRNCP